MANQTDRDLDERETSEQIHSACYTSTESLLLRIEQPVSSNKLPDFDFPNILTLAFLISLDSDDSILSVLW